MSAQIKVQLTRKRCSKCGEVKDATAFPRDRRSSTGLHSRCRDCHNVAQLESWHRLRGEGPRAKWAEIARQNAAEIEP